MSSINSVDFEGRGWAAMFDEFHRYARGEATARAVTREPPTAARRGELVLLGPALGLSVGDGSPITVQSQPDADCIRVDSEPWDGVGDDPCHLLEVLPSPEAGNLCAFMSPA